MVTILTYISLIAGGILLLLFLLSSLSGLDLDFEMDLDSDVDSDPGYGAVKSILTFLSMSAWMMRAFILTNTNLYLALFIGVISGLVSVWILSFMFKTLMRNNENVNWAIEDSLYQEGKVYLKIPADGVGIVNVLVNGVNREIKAKSNKKTELKTGTIITVIGFEGECVLVETV